MEQVESFAKLLHETVVGNKLSATRVDRVKQSATAGLHLAGSLVKAIHKIHFRASNSTKLSSLYLFDAVARHARDITKGRAEGYDYTCVKAPPGSGKQDGSREALEAGASEFVKRAATIVCEVVEDSLRNVTPEQKEKVKKIVDIWAKAGTFEGRMIKELQEMVARHAAGPDTVIASKEVESSQRSTTPTGDPRHSSYYSLFQQGGSQAQDDVGGGANHAQPVAPTQASLIPQNILALLESASSTSSAAASASTVASPGQPSAATPQARPQADQPGPSQAPVDFMSSLASMLGQATSGNQSQIKEQRSQVTNQSKAPSFDAGQIAMLQRLSQQRQSPSQPQTNQEASTTIPRGSGITTGFPKSHGSPAIVTGRQEVGETRRNLGPSRPISLPARPDGALAELEEGLGRREGVGASKSRSRSRSPASSYSKRPDGLPLPPSSSALRYPEDLNRRRSPTLGVRREPVDDGGDRSLLGVRQGGGTGVPNAGMERGDEGAKLKEKKVAVVEGEEKEDLTSFDITSFNPTEPREWQRLANMWKNSHGYMPSNQELMMATMSANFMIPNHNPLHLVPLVAGGPPVGMWEGAMSGLPNGGPGSDVGSGYHHQNAHRMEKVVEQQQQHLARKPLDPDPSERRANLTLQQGGHAKLDFQQGHHNGYEEYPVDLESYHGYGEGRGGARRRGGGADRDESSHREIDAFEIVTR